MHLVHKIELLFCYFSAKGRAEKITKEQLDFIHMLMIL